MSTIGLICNKQNSATLFFEILTANSISTGQPNALFPIDRISRASFTNGIVSHFNIGAKDTIRVPFTDRVSLMVSSSLEITLPHHLNAPSSSASSRE